jgi:hypothetical protein
MTRTRVALALGAVVTAVLVSAPTASAATDPGTFAVARKGHLLVASSVLVANRKVEMMGGWVNDNMSCDRRRRLDVRVIIDRVRRGDSERFRDEVSGLVENCAEAGPNFGFQLTASQVGMACPRRKLASGAVHLRDEHLAPSKRAEGDRQSVLQGKRPLLGRMRLAGIEPATSRSGGARSIP